MNRRNSLERLVTTQFISDMLTFEIEHAGTYMASRSLDELSMEIKSKLKENYHSHQVINFCKDLGFGVYRIKGETVVAMPITTVLAQRDALHAVREVEQKADREAAIASARRLRELFKRQP